MIYLEKLRDYELEHWIKYGVDDRFELGRMFVEQGVPPMKPFSKFCVAFYHAVIRMTAAEFEAMPRYLFASFSFELKCRIATRKKKREVRASTRRAARIGIIELKPCEACGDPDSEFHHWDYGNPLNISCVCRGCHAATHKDLRQKGIEIAA